MKLLLLALSLSAFASDFNRISNEEAQRVASYSDAVRSAITKLKNWHILNIQHEEVLALHDISKYSHEVTYYYIHDQGQCFVSVTLGLQRITNQRARITRTEPYVMYSNSDCQ